MPRIVRSQHTRTYPCAAPAETNACVTRTKNKVLGPPHRRPFDSLHHRGARCEEEPVAAAAAPPVPLSAPPLIPPLSATAATAADAAADAAPPALRRRRSVSLPPHSRPPSVPPASALAAAAAKAPKGEGFALPLLPGEFGRGGVSFGFDHGGGSRVLCDDGGCAGGLG